MKDLDSLCKEIRNSDASIMSITIADIHGNLLTHSYGSEYQQKYLESASVVRSKAGFTSAIIMGMEEQADEVFGSTEAIVKIHKKAKLIIIPFPSKTKVLTLLVTREALDDSIIRKAELILQGQ